MNYITPKEAARQLSVSPKTIIRAARRGELQAIQIGRQWRVRLDLPGGLLPFPSNGLKRA